MDRPLSPDTGTDKNIIGELLSIEGKPSSLKPWSNGTQKASFLVALGFLGLGFFAALAAKVWFPSDMLKWLALVAISVSQIATVIYQLSFFIPAIKTLRSPSETIAEPAERNFGADIQTISNLARVYEQQELDYARDRLTQVVEQMKFRVGFMIGAVEKVGILPGAVAGYFYAKEILAQPANASSGIEWVFAGIAAFYFLAAIFLTASQRVERMALVAKHAAAKKASMLVREPAPKSAN